MTVRGVRCWAPAVILPIMVAWCWPNPARAGSPPLTPPQREALVEARAIGARYRVPSLILAIIWQESSFCAHRIGDDGKSFGCGQVQLGTARKITGHRVRVHRLIHDRAFNLELTARYLSACIEEFGIERGIYCYNGGPVRAARASWHAVTHDRYVRGVLARLDRLGSLTGS